MKKVKTLKDSISQLFQYYKGLIKKRFPWEWVIFFPIFDALIWLWGLAAKLLLPALLAHIITSPLIATLFLYSLEDDYDYP